MALAKCRECGKEVSTMAKTCPSCGVSKPVRRTSVGTWIVTGIAAIFLVSVFKTGNSPEPPKTVIAKAPPTKEEIQDAADTKRVATLVLAVKQSLHDPKSLDVSDAWVTDSGVAIQYRAKNAFGALIINYAVLTNDGKVATGSKDSVATLWNKHIAKRPTKDYTAVAQNAARY